MAARAKVQGHRLRHRPLAAGENRLLCLRPQPGPHSGGNCYAGIDDLDVDQLSLYLDDVLVAVNGGRNPAYQEEDGQQVMNKAEILVRVVLGRGDASATVWTCDFSYDYVRINADYRS